jgi:lipoprotein-anchoring transpeptidase ErfK/SrfK
MRLASILVLLGLVSLSSSCTNQTEMVIRRPAPGGGYYVQRIQVPKPVKEKKVKAPKPDKKKPDAAVDDGSRWFGEGMTGKPRLKICLGEQRIYFYKDDQLAGISPMSSGREGMETRPGKFKVTEKDIDHKSSLFGDYVGKDGVVVKKEADVRKDPKPAGAVFDAAEMPFFMRINGAIGMHQGFLPGYPASHGCIRLPKHMAEIFFRETPLGTLVEIVP